MCSELHFEDLRLSHWMHVRAFISVSLPNPRPWRTSCNSPHEICNVHGRLGCHLTTLFGNNTAVSIKKRSLLPLLTVLFLFSYGLMTLLIVEQGTTIQSQRALIRDLFSDSM